MPSAVSTASPMKRGASRIFKPSARCRTSPMRKSSTGRPIRKSTNGTLTPASGRSVRGKYTFVTSGRFDEQAQAREGQGGSEVLHRQHAGDHEAGYGVSPAGKFANFPNMTT